MHLAEPRYANDGSPLVAFKENKSCGLGQSHQMFEAAT